MRKLLNNKINCIMAASLLTLTGLSMTACTNHKELSAQTVESQTTEAQAKDSREKEFETKDTLVLNTNDSARRRRRRHAPPGRVRARAHRGGADGADAPGRRGRGGFQPRGTGGGGRGVGIQNNMITGGRHQVKTIFKHKY